MSHRRRGVQFSVEPLAPVVLRRLLPLLTVHVEQRDEEILLDPVLLVGLPVPPELPHTYPVPVEGLRLHVTVPTLHERLPLTVVRHAHLHDAVVVRSPAYV